MTTVYLVSSGSYSDYSIRAAFSTRELAQAYIDHLRGPDGQGRTEVNEDIEEFTLDEPRETWPGAWVVDIDPHGNVVKTFWSDSDPTVRPFHDKGVLAGQYGSYSRPEMFRGYGETPEHARRSAEELRRQTLAHPGVAP